MSIPYGSGRWLLELLLLLELLSPSLLSELLSFFSFLYNSIYMIFWKIKNDISRPQQRVQKMQVLKFIRQQINHVRAFSGKK